MSEEPNQVGDEQPRRRLSPVAVLLALLVLYPLSVGPAAGFIYRFGGVSNFTTVYKPLAWLTEQSPLLSRLVNRYIECFR